MRNTISASSIEGTKVHNRQSEDLGTVEDVMINTQSGDISYLVLSYGGIFGTTLADKRFAVPYDAIDINHDGDDTTYILDVDKSFLENAEGFDKDHYPNFADPTFKQTTDSYYKSIGSRRNRAA